MSCDAGEQCQPATQQVFGQLLADIAPVAEQLADQVAGQRWERRGVMDIARGQLQGQEFIGGVEDEVQVEAEDQPIGVLPRWARSANTLGRLRR